MNGSATDKSLAALHETSSESESPTESLLFGLSGIFTHRKRSHWLDGNQFARSATTLLRGSNF